jgi:E3 ubiquitin-protein ligase UBR7
VLQIPRDEEGEPLYEDFICHKCSPICSFLKLYSDEVWASSKKISSSQADKNDSNVMEGPSDYANSDKHENDVINHVGSENTSTEDNCTKDISAPEKANLDSSGSGCKLETDIDTTSADSEKIMPIFMSRGWRDTLCRCEKCVNFYTRQGVAYLIDKEDSIEEYEKIAKQKRLKKLEQQEGAETNFLNSLGHVQKIEILSGINDMKNELQSFLVTLHLKKLPFNI